MIYAETSYQSVADLAVGLYPHGAVIDGILLDAAVICFGYHFGILRERIFYAKITQLKKKFGCFMIVAVFNSEAVISILFSSGMNLQSNWTNTFSRIIASPLDTLVIRVTKIETVRKEKPQRLGRFSRSKRLFRIPMSIRD